MTATFLRSGFLSLGVRALNLSLAFATAIVLARILGPAGFGVYTFSFALVRILSIPAQLGFQVLSVRELAADQAQQQWGRMKGFITFSVGMILVASIVLAVLTALFARGYFYTTDKLTFESLLVAAVLLPILALSNYFGTAIRGVGSVVVGQLPDLVIRPGMHLLLVSIVLLAGSTLGFDPLIAMKLHIVAAAIAVSAGMLVLYRLLNHAVISLRAEFSIREWMSSSSAMCIVAIVFVINGQADLIILGMLSDSETVGIYRISVQGAVLVGLGLQVSEVIVAPKLSELYSLDKLDELAAIAKRATRIAFILAAPVATILVLFGSSILEMVFGAEFIPGYVPLIFLSIGYLIAASFGPVLVLLNMTKNEQSVVKMMTATAVTNVLLNLVLIPRFGATGAAVASMTSLILLCGGLHAFVRRKLGVSIFVLGHR